MKVLHVMEHSLPKLAGYTIRSKYIVEKQKIAELDPVVITSPLMKSSILGASEVEFLEGIKYYRTNRYNTIKTNDLLFLRLIKRYKYSIKYKQCIKSVLRQEFPDVIHSHSSYLNGVSANSAARKFGIPKIYEVRGFWQDTAVIGQNLNSKHWKYRFISYLDNVAMQGADIIVAISKTIKKELIEKGINTAKIRVVPNGVDTSIFQPCKKDQKICDSLGLNDKIVIGFIGSIRKIEGLSWVLEVMPEIIGRFNNVVFIIVGGGDREVEELERLSSIHGLGNNVIFAGKVDHESIRNWYSVMDIVIYPRIDAKVNQQVTPLKPLEAMAMEKPVLASDVGGLREFIKHEYNGLLFKANNSDDFIIKCGELLSNTTLRITLGKSARSWVIKKREWKNVIEKYFTIYEEVINRKRK